MNRIEKIFFLLFIVLINNLFVSCNKSPTPTVNENNKTSTNEKIFNFSLIDHFGEYYELFRQSDKDSIYLIAQSEYCRENERIENELSKEISSHKNLSLIFLNSDQIIDRNLLVQKSIASKSKTPILLDSSQSIASLLNFTNVSDYIQINPKNWTIIKKGNLTKNIKCKINYIPEKKISYKDDIAPIFMNKCINCHSEKGGFLPHFSSFEKIKAWAKMSRETILTQRMPPISYDPHFGQYSNDISLTNLERRKIVKWLSNGLSNVEKIDPLKNYTPSMKGIKNNDELIYTAEMESPHPIPPGGEVVYKYFQLGGPVPFDMWATSYKTISTNRRQLHHESIMVTSMPLKFYERIAYRKYENIKDKINKNIDGDINTFILETMTNYETNNDIDYFIKLQIWGAGKKEKVNFPNNLGIFIPKGSYLILETHYMGTGKNDSEKTTLKFFGKKYRPKNFKPIKSFRLMTKKFTIPPNEKNFEVRTDFWSPKEDINIEYFLAHMHMRGKSVRAELTDKNNQTRTIVSIPNFYYGWQTGASLRPNPPILVKSSDRLQVICHYDNSKENPYNPNPNKSVSFGQTVDRTEMCKININYTNAN
jgi:hypothetical protein